MACSRATGLPLQLRYLCLRMCGSIQAVEIGACIAVGGVVAIAGVVYEVWLGGADEVAQLIVPAYVRTVTWWAVEAGLYAMGILSG